MVKDIWFGKKENTLVLGSSMLVSRRSDLLYGPSPERVGYYLGWVIILR